MKRILVLSLTILALQGICFAQASGNAAYSQSSGNTRAKQNERAKRVLQQGELPPTGTSMFVEANVLMNVRSAAIAIVRNTRFKARERAAPSSLMG